LRRNGDQLVHIEIHSKAVGHDLGVNVIVPPLWFEGGETAPGAFDDADFEANDVVSTVEENPDAFGGARVWIDYGTEDPFRVYDEGFVAAMEAGGADLTAHSRPGAHEGSYWNDHWPDYQRFYVNALAHCD